MLRQSERVVPVRELPQRAERGRCPSSKHVTELTAVGRGALLNVGFEYEELQAEVMLPVVAQALGDSAKGMRHKDESSLEI